MVVKERDFLRTFILELILAQKENVFLLWDEEIVDLPNNYIKIFDQIVEDEVKKLKYANLIPMDNRLDWKCNITKELHDFLKSSGVDHVYKDSSLKIKLNNHAIFKIQSNKKISDEDRKNISTLAEEFILVTTKTKPRQKTLV